MHCNFANATDFGKHNTQQHSKLVTLFTNFKASKPSTGLRMSQSLLGVANIGNVRVDEAQERG